MRRLLTTFLAGYLSIVASARQPEPTKPVTPAQPAAVPEPKPEPAIQPPEPPVVTLLEAGSEPRQALRFAPAVGFEQATVLRVSMHIGVDMGQGENANSFPVMLITMKMKVTDVTPEGDIRYNTAIADCRFDPAPGTPKDMLDAMELPLAPLKRLTGVCTMSNRGIPKETRFIIPSDLTGDAAAPLTGLSDQLSQIGVQLPEEQVGVGAKWSIKSKVRSQGIRIDQTMTYTLTEVRDGTVFVKMEVEQTAPSQKIDAPEATFMLHSLSSKGGGTMELPLSMVGPARGESKLSSDLSLTFSNNGTDTKMKQNVKLEMTISPATAAAPTPVTPSAPAALPATPAGP